MKSARQTQITSDLLQAPGNKKLIQTAAVKQDDQTQQFPIWLHTISTRFMGLRDRQRIQVLDTLLGLCGAAELTHLSALLPTLLYRDFLRLLPVETSEHIVLYLDPKSLLNCCLVSFYWNELINSFRQVWMKLASRAGARVNVDPCCTVPMYKHLFLQTTHLVHSMKNKTAFETITLEGHQRPVVAIAHDGDNIVATGSDDQTVRFWDINTGECVKLIHTHSVSCLQFDDMYIYTGSHDATAARWDRGTGELLCQCVGHISTVFTLDVRRGFDIIITGSADTTVKIWQLMTGVLLNTLSDCHSHWVTQVRILNITPRETTEANMGTIRLVSVDAYGCCFWTVDLTDDAFNVSCFKHDDDFFSKPILFVTAPDTLSIARWNKRRRQTISTYATGVDTKLIPHCVSSIIMPDELPGKPLNETTVGVGDKFAMLAINVTYSRIMIVDKHSSGIIAEIPMPPFRIINNGAPVLLGNPDWLDGFTPKNRSGLFMGVCLEDNNVLLLTWKETT